MPAATGVSSASPIAIVSMSSETIVNNNINKSSSGTSATVTVPLPPPPAHPLPVTSSLIVQPNAGLMASAERVHARSLSQQQLQPPQSQPQSQPQPQPHVATTTTQISNTSSSRSSPLSTAPSSSSTSPVVLSPTGRSPASLSPAPPPPKVVVVVMAPAQLDGAPIATATINYARAHRRILFKEAVRSVIRDLREAAANPASHLAASASNAASTNATPTQATRTLFSSCAADGLSHAADGSGDAASLPRPKTIALSPAAKGSAAPGSIGASPHPSSSTTTTSSSLSPNKPATASSVSPTNRPVRPLLAASRTPKLLASLEAAGAALSTSNVHAALGVPAANGANGASASAAHGAAHGGGGGGAAGDAGANRSRSALRSAFSFMKSVTSALGSSGRAGNSGGGGHYAPRGPLANPNARYPVLLDDASNEAGMEGGAATSGLRFVFPPEHVKPHKRVEYERLCEELVSTERTYLQGLHVAIHSFMARLRAAVQLSKPVLSASEIETVFSNIEELYKANQAMFKELLELKHKGRLYTPELHHVLANHASPFAKYSSYACDYYDGNKLLTSLREKREDVDFFFRLNEVAEKARLDDYLITPIQRIPRYILLLRSMRACAEDGHHSTSTAIDKALAAMSNIAASINDDVHVRDAIKQVGEIEATLERLPYRLANGSRFHVMNGPLRKKYSHSSFKRGQFCEMWFFLFSDLLVYTSMPDKKGFRTVRKVLPLRDTRVDESHDARLMYAFTLDCHSVKSVTVCATTEQEKLKWINRLQHQISATRLAASSESSGADAGAGHDNGAVGPSRTDAVKGAMAAGDRGRTMHLARHSRSSTQLTGLTPAPNAGAAGATKPANASSVGGTVGANASARHVRSGSAMNMLSSTTPSSSTALPLPANASMGATIASTIHEVDEDDDDEREAASGGGGAGGHGSDEAHPVVSSSSTITTSLHQLQQQPQAVA